MAKDSRAHNVIYPDKLWAEAKTIAETRNERMSTLLVRLLTDYVEKNR